MASRNVDLIIKARDEASKAFDAVNGALADLADVQKRVSSGAAEVGRGLAEGRDDAQKFTQEIERGTSRAANQAARAMDRITAAVEQARAKFDANERQLEESRQAYAALERQAESAQRAIVSAKIAERQGQGSARLEAAQKAYRELTNEAARLEKTISAQQDRLEQSQANLAKVENAAISTSAAYERLTVVQRETNQAAQESVAGLRQQVAAQKQAAQEAANTFATQLRAAREAREAAEAQAQAATRAAQENVAAQQRIATSFRRSSAAAREMNPSFRRGVEALLRVGPAADEAARGMNRAAAGALNMRRAFAAFYGDSRRALSFMQRIRGEVLSLTASFVGFYGIFRAGNSFLESFKTMEAATNRFSAAFKNDAREVGAELAFLQKEARRLGFSFGTLSDTYSKFLISSQQAGIATDETRKIFTQVAEAARVLKLDNEQVNGVLTAMSQIAGKGTLQMEELRQQLGDRLPGAVGILAKALGYGQDELAQFYDDVENGQVQAREALVALGQGLSDTYGGQLSGALDNVTAKLGTFQNLLFERQLTAANSGFIAGLEEALDGLSAWLESEDGIEFFETLGAAFGNMLKVIPQVLENLDKFVALGKALFALKLSQVVGGFAGSLQAMVPTQRRMLRAQVQLNTAIRNFSPAMAVAMRGTGRMGAALRGLRSVMASVAVSARALWTAIGGPIGAITSALTLFAFDAIGSTDEEAQRLNDTLQAQADIVSDLQAAYLSASEGAKDWRKNLESTTEIQIEAKINDIEQELRNFRRDADNTLNTLQGSASEVRAGLRARGADLGVSDLIEQLIEADRAFNEGDSSATEFRQRIIEIGNAAKEAGVDMTDILADFLDVADGGKELEDALAELHAGLRLMRGEATEADKELLGLGNAAEESADGMNSGAEAVEAFNDAMEELAKNIPGLQAELDRFDAIAKIEADFQSALAAARNMPDAIRRIAAEQEAMNRRTAAMNAANYEYANDGSASVVDRIIAIESGGDPNAKNPNSSATGAGQFIESTWIAMMNKYMPQLAASMGKAALLELRNDPDISREMVGRYTAENATALQGAGNSVTPGNLYLSHFLGPGGANSLLGAAPGTSANDILPSGVVSANASILDGKTREEVIAWAERKMGISEVELGYLQDQNEATRDRAEAQREFNQEVENSVANARFEAEIADKALLDREVAKALREAENEAAAEGLELTQKQRDEIAEATRLKFAQAAADERENQAQEARNQKLEEARRLEAEVTRLKERRSFLEEQSAYYAEQGNTSGVAETEAELQEVNAALDQAIQKAIQFWQAIGGDGSKAAIQSLQQTQAELKRTENTATFTGEQIANVFAGAVVSAVDRFARRVADGENAIQVFKEEFMRMAGEILIQLAQMIIQQAVFNALTGGSGPGGGIAGAIAGGMNSLFHTGGIVGQASAKRSTNPAVFADAIRYHSGGVAGLRPDEMPAILRKGEEVLTENDPRHRYNGGGQAESPTIINAVDGTDALEKALSDSRGGRVLLNHIKANRSAFKAALGG